MARSTRRKMAGKLSARIKPLSDLCITMSLGPNHRPFFYLQPLKTVRETAKNLVRKTSVRSSMLERNVASASYVDEHVNKPEWGPKKPHGG